VRRRPAEKRPQQAPGDNRVGRCPADALLRSVAERVDPAGPHGAVPATDAQPAKPALRLLRFEPVPGNGNIRVAGTIEHRQRGRIDRPIVVVRHGSFSYCSE